MQITQFGAAVMVPILTTLGLFAMVFGIVYLSKRENLAMIEKGMNPKRKENRKSDPARSMKWGLLLAGAGLGLFVAYMLDRLVLHDKDSEPVYYALIAIGGGIGLILSYKVEMKNARNNPVSKEEE